MTESCYQLLGYMGILCKVGESIEKELDKLDSQDNLWDAALVIRGLGLYMNEVADKLEEAAEWLDEQEDKKEEE